MSEKIIVRINDTPKIIVRMNDIPEIIVHFGEQGLKGNGGVTDHALLTNLDYDHANHNGFQRQLKFISEYKAYEIE